MPRSTHKPVKAQKVVAVVQSAAVGMSAARRATSDGNSPAERIHIGTSGWAYATWKPGFYPADISAKNFLEYYGTQLNSVEVNYTFRKLPSDGTLAGWIAATPAGFRFSFKAPQRITHFNRLRECQAQVTEFVAALKPAQVAGKLGTLLFQLPPNFKADTVRLAEFLSLPEFCAASAPRVAVEFRHVSWFTEATYEVLRTHDAALCIAEGDELQTPEIQCARTHTCYRLRRTDGYSVREIEVIAEKVLALAKTRDVYIYFRHEDEPTGALNAVTLLEACAAGAGK